MVTNTEIKKICPIFKRIPTMPFNRGIAGLMPGSSPIQWDMPEAGPGMMSFRPGLEIETTTIDAVVQPEKEKKTIVRKNFPETWMWDLIPIEDSSNGNVHRSAYDSVTKWRDYSAPDTITDWSAVAFCLGSSGIGISPTASLRTFQPFFVQISTPYSVNRGETFTMKASVFNYLPQNITVQVILEKSAELLEQPCEDCLRRTSIQAEESMTFHWNLMAKQIGEVNITLRTEALDTSERSNKELTAVPKQGSIDTIIRPLLVKPEGVLEEKSHSSMLCSKGKDGSDNEEISLKVPDNMVKDSERAHISVRGDLMGAAMKNLHRLLALPFGCGEQNMVLFAPNIFILKYLEKTHQLHEEIKDKATNFLKSGYQRQLTYKRDDGSYSAFGKKDPEGNTWLTAFVLKCFGMAGPYTYINEEDLDHSMLWLTEKQKPDGSFKKVGKLLNNGMKGGIDDEVSLTAYVSIALLEAGMPKNDHVVQRALSYLRNASPGVKHMYNQALLAFTFTVSGEEELRQSMLEKLDKQAVRGEGQMHWERKTMPQSSDAGWHHAPSAEVEVTSYVLLALVSGSSLEKNELAKASEIVNWLSKQQNPYGGFSSTQDTVVALQAMARYAQATFSEQGAVTVTVRGHTGFEQKFHVDERNRLLLQSVPLPGVPGEYTVTAAGSGCVYIQTVLRYNVPPPKSDATFEIRVETEPKKCPKDPVTVFEMHIYTKYTGHRETSNMALVEIKMLSGFSPVISSIQSLETQKLIQRSDIQKDSVTFYLNELQHEPVHLSLTMEQEVPVRNRKPATVTVYDYYEKGLHRDQRDIELE
ncbi:alpha-2-macroglobulin-like protein 1 [Discoglossus pictus]